MPKQRKASPERYEDPLEVTVNGDRITPATTRVTPAVPVVVTGLSDEEDARRHMEREFNPYLRFCTNCEAYYNIEDFEYHWCPYCGSNLAPIGTMANRRKFSSR